MPQLRVAKGASQGETRALPKRVTRLGRGGDIDPNDRQASRHHAEVSYFDELYFLKDVGSRNGTFLNGERLQPNQEVALSQGDVIRIGETEFVFEQATSGGSPKADAAVPTPGAPGAAGPLPAQEPGDSARKDFIRRASSARQQAPRDWPLPPPVPCPCASSPRTHEVIEGTQGRVEEEQAGALIAQGWWAPALGIHEDYVDDIFRPLSCSSPVGLYATDGGLLIQSRALGGGEKLRVGLSLAHQMVYISCATLWFLIRLPLYLLCVPFQLLTLNFSAFTTLYSALLSPVAIVFAVVRWAQALKELLLLLSCVCRGRDYYWVTRGWQPMAPNLATLSKGDVSELHLLRARPQSRIVSAQSMLYLLGLGVVAYYLQGLIPWMGTVAYASLFSLVFMLII